jgi:hypothetical protein
LQSTTDAPAAASGESEARIVRPMVTMELFEVRRRNDLPREWFTYAPGDQNVEDQTDVYLQKLRLPIAN